MIKEIGKVYLVGAGPGDVEYLTVKAYRLLASAEVLVYDALVDSQLLDCVPVDCLKIDVGKRGGKPSTSQNEINDLLVKYCFGWEVSQKRNFLVLILLCSDSLFLILFLKKKINLFPESLVEIE